MKIDEMEFEKIRLDTSTFVQYGHMNIYFIYKNHPYRLKFGKERTGNYIVFAVFHEENENNCPLCHDANYICRRFIHETEEKLLKKLIKDKAVRLKLLTDGIFEQLR